MEIAVKYFIREALKIALDMKASTRLISWNVNGIRAVKKKGFDDFVQHYQPDILCLQEIKIDAEAFKPEDMVPPAYQSYCSHAEKKGYSGVATLVNNGLQPKKEKIIKGLGDNLDSEGRCLISEHEAFILYNLYLPSGTTGDARQTFKYSYLDSLLAHFKSLSKKKRDKLILCGDFNICHKDIDIHHPRVAEKRELSGFLPEERQWMDALCKAGFVDTFRHVKQKEENRYTWWSFRAGSRKKNLGWRIDYFFTAKALADKILNADILEHVEGSDHCPVLLDLAL